MKLNQLDERQRNFSLNNSHSSPQVDSEDEDYLIKILNDDLKERFIKTSNMKNDDFKKH